MKVLTVIKSIKEGDFTFNLMNNGKVHINNHKTGKSSMWVSGDRILRIFEINLK